jgi:DNA-binding NtrC family response regulator
MEFHWPGNVRELENVIERACAMAKSSVLEAEDIRLDAGRPKPALESGALLPEGVTLEQWEDELIREALRRTAGNKSRAARMLGLSRNALRYRLSRMGIADEPEKES